MATYKLTSQEVDFIAAGCAIPETVLGIAGLAPSHDIDTYYNDDMSVYVSGSGSVSWRITHDYSDITPSLQHCNLDLRPSIGEKYWGCPYCGARNYCEVGHCHHCASPRRY